MGSGRDERGCRKMFIDEAIELRKDLPDRLQRGCQ